MDLNDDTGYTVQGTNSGWHIVDGCGCWVATYESQSEATVASAGHELLEACKEALGWLDNAEIDYSNGVTHMGIDEGQVLGRRGHEAVTGQLRTAIAKAEGKTT